MVIDILTLFPEMFEAPLGKSIIGRAADKGLLAIRTHQIRDFTTNRQNQVDDYPYGGGRGCVMTAQPLHSAWEHAQSLADCRTRTIYFSPRGRVFTQTDAIRLSREYDRLILVCGHYEGVDQRFIDTCVDDEISLGDFVLTGGEIPAMALADAVCRLVPGVLADESCFTNESHWAGLLEHPHYSRPDVWAGLEVPEVLRGGDHSAIEAWRRKQAFLTTLQCRPDMFETLLFSRGDLKLLGELRDETEDVSVRSALSMFHTGRITVRETSERDTKGLSKLFDHPAAYIASLADSGIRDFSIYADDHGFCGHIWVRAGQQVALLEMQVLPHAQGKGIDTFAVAHVLDALFAADSLESCVVTTELPADLVRRIGFLPNEAGIYTLSREAWLSRR